MNLRIRLILAFFLLSVVPLGALTLYSYTSSARAAREAARREAELLAGELAQRMKVVTTQLSERVEHLMNLADASEATPAVEDSEAGTAEAVSAAVTASATTVSETLGSLAMLLNNVELRGTFGRGRRGGRRGGRAGPDGGAGSGGRGESGRGGRARGLGDPDGRPPGAPGRARGGGTPSSASPPADVAADSVTIDMMPIRREIMEQYASRDEFSALSSAERQDIMGEVNQLMLGIQTGIRMGTAEAQRRIAEAQSAAEETARAAAVAVAVVAPVPAPSEPSAPLQRRTTLSGGRLDVTMERDGEVVHGANAEVDMPSLLGTVFSTTRRDRGEVPFAVGRDGHLYTPTDEDRAKIEALGESVTDVDAPTGTAVLGDWILVTSADPTGAGLKFGIARPVGDALNSLRRSSAWNAAIGLGFIGLALIGIVPLSSRLTRNLSRLSDGVRRIAKGDYRARVEVRSHDEIGRLAVAFNHMAEDVERHQLAAVGQERIKRELELGRQIQHDMLPHLPLRLGLTEIKGVSVPAREVGGDFFNYFQIATGQVALLVGDVSGKGVGAALLMANIQASLRTRMALGQDLASIARELDVEVDTGTPGAVYSTLFIAMLDLETRELRYVNAGHNPQYVLRQGGGLEDMPSTGMPVGLLSGHGYGEGLVQLAPGDLLFFYTDGCVEAENESGEMFGSDRFEALLKSGAATVADDVLVYIEAELARFRGAAEAFDDATMMAVKVG